MIGVFGGTFDPIHLGHLRVALDALQLLGLDQLRFVPLAQAVHRRQPVASSAQRLAMLQAAIAGQAGFSVDTRELERGTPSYTVDTLDSLRRELGPDLPICLVIGADAFRGFADWREPARILRLAHLVILTRPGHDHRPDPRLQQLVGPLDYASEPGMLRSAAAGRCLPLAVSALEISATDIRERRHQHREIRYLVPDSVRDVILREHIY